MTFDKQEHKDICLQCINQTSFPGHLLDIAYELKKAVESAEVRQDSGENGTDKKS